MNTNLRLISLLFRDGKACMNLCRNSLAKMKKELQGRGILRKLLVVEPAFVAVPKTHWLLLLLLMPCDEVATDCNGSLTFVTAAIDWIVDLFF